MKKHSNDFGNDSVPGLVLRTSIPFMFAQFVNVLYSIVDRIYIGNIPQIGDVSLAGAGICAPVITLLSSFATLIGIGGSVLFSMRLGAKDQEKAKNLLGTSFSMLLFFSAALTILFLLLKAPLLQWFGASKTTFPYANTYMTIYTLGTFFALLSMGMNYFITAQTSAIRFEFDDPVAWTLDGEFGGSVTDVTIQNHSRAIEMIVPR